jgi:hypothetical protein
MIFRSRVGAFVPCDALGDTKRCGLPPHPVRPPVAFPEDGIRDQGKAVGTEAADGFAILVCPLSEAKWSEAKCPPAASRRLGLPRNQTPLRLSRSSVRPSRIAATISDALCRGNSVSSPWSSTATASILCQVRVASRHRRRARFNSSRTTSEPTNTPSTKPPKAAHTMIGSTVIALTKGSALSEKTFVDTQFAV